MNSLENSWWNLSNANRDVNKCMPGLFGCAPSESGIAQSVGSRLEAATCRIRDVAELKGTLVDFGSNYQLKYPQRGGVCAKVKGLNTETRSGTRYAHR